MFLLKFEIIFKNKLVQIYNNNFLKKLFYRIYFRA